MPTESLIRRAASEGIGTALLLAAIVGSGIMGQRLAPAGNAGIALLANSLATGAALVALIITFGSISAHFNPLVSITNVMQGQLLVTDLPAYIGAQLAGAFAGVVCANAMFGEPIVVWSTSVRSGLPQSLAEAVATFGLLAVCWRQKSEQIPFAVGGYITAAYWFTSSTSFANPAVTLARMLTNTFAGIRPHDVPTFLAGQFVGTLIALFVLRWLMPSSAQALTEVRPARSLSSSVEVA